MKYVVELARALANTEGVHRVDLLTRQISSPEVDYSYGEPVEMLSCPPEGSDSCGSYIIRIPCGSRDKYYHIKLLGIYVFKFLQVLTFFYTHVFLNAGTYQRSHSGPIFPSLLMGR